MSDNRNLVMTRDQVKQVTGDNHQRIKEFEKLLGRLSSDPVEPITVAITGNTTYTLANDRGTQAILIPEAMLKASAGGPFTLTITTEVGDSVIVPIAASGDTILSGDLLFDIYIDSSGNVISKAWKISGSNANGSYVFSYDRKLDQYGATGTLTSNVVAVAPIFSSAATAVTFPVAFVGANPKVFPSVIEGLAQGFAANYAGVSLTGCTVRLYGPTVASTGIVTWHANGGW